MNKIVKGNFCKGKLYSGENLISEICEDGYYNLAVWNKLFKRSIFDKIRFPDNKSRNKIFLSAEKRQYHE